MITLTLLHPVKQTPVQVWTFADESVIRIGRSTDNQVILYSAVVSRYHVELRRTGAHWEVVNLGTNGTYLDGKRINHESIKDGAVIRLARSGPNIQIRMGEVAPENRSATSPVLRMPTQQPQDFPMIPTEVTHHNVDEEEESEMGLSNPSFSRV